MLGVPSRRLSRHLSLAVTHPLRVASKRDGGWEEASSHGVVSQRGGSYQSVEESVVVAATPGRFTGP